MQSDDFAPLTAASRTDPCSSAGKGVTPGIVPAEMLSPMTTTDRDAGAEPPPQPRVMLTIRELAIKYPVAGADNIRGWERIIRNWQIYGQIIEGKHWKYRRSGNRERPPKEYSEQRIAFLLIHTNSPFAVSVRTAHAKALRANITSQG